MDRIKAKTHTSNRRTKIVCTMGPACWSRENIAILMDSGMNVARFNFSHGDHQGHGAVLDRLREVASEKSRNIAGACSAACAVCVAFSWGSTTIRVDPKVAIVWNRTPNYLVQRYRCSRLLFYFHSILAHNTHSLVGYQGTRDSNWVLCQRRQEDLLDQGRNSYSHIGRKYSPTTTRERSKTFLFWTPLELFYRSLTKSRFTLPLLATIT